MDWMQFVAALVESLAWPAVAVVMVALLRKPITKLIPQIRTFKYKDLHVDLGEKLEEVKEAVKKDAVDAQNPIPSSPPLAAQPDVLSLARLDPRAAILSSWLDVERALRALALKAGIPFDATPLSTASELHAADVIDEFTFKTLRDLRRIRNEAAHITTRDISYEEAVSMAEMCQWLAHRLRNDTDGSPA
ncbi:hypothetical protein [Pseudomonas syringae]|uniref:hypothetical protein n=1 Tax=Pseudomonas syringae TaxID=317 RepID=UPI0004E6C3FC|nr:hypothetical protein [Pseudomonas syringae]KFF84225.1 hypothetical protein HM80_08450 [Pseudomonas syringae pv. syringae]